MISMLGSDRAIRPSTFCVLAASSHAWTIVTELAWGIHMVSFDRAPTVIDGHLHCSNQISDIQRIPSMLQKRGRIKNRGVIYHHSAVYLASRRLNGSRCSAWGCGVVDCRAPD